jgi:hypothetical protein
MSLRLSHRTFRTFGSAATCSLGHFGLAALHITPIIHTAILMLQELAVPVDVKLTETERQAGHAVIKRLLS